MGSAVERLIALTQVKAHTRVEKTGKVTQVKAYEKPDTYDEVGRWIQPDELKNLRAKDYWDTPFSEVYDLMLENDKEEKDNYHRKRVGQLIHILQNEDYDTEQPILLDGDRVLSGHHRVVAAMRARKPVYAVDYGGGITPRKKEAVALSRVRAHTRKTASGKVAQVREYDRAPGKDLLRELDAQGLSSASPLRGVFNKQGAQFIASRDSAGRINGGVAYYVEGAGTKRSVTLVQMRVLDQHKGIGQSLIAKLAKEVGPEGSLTVVGAVSSAKPFYALTGADFSYLSDSHGTWSRKAIDAMQRGQTPVPGHVETEAEFREAERETLVREYPQYAEEKAQTDQALAATLARLMALSHVKAHTRTTAKGKVVAVKAYDNKIKKKGKALVLDYGDRPAPDQYRYDGIESSPSPDDYYAVEDYTSNGAYTNDWLRGRPNKEQNVSRYHEGGDQTEVVKSLDAVFAHHTTTKPFSTYRVVTRGTERADWLKPHYAPGAVMHDEGYTSTTPYGGIIAGMSVGVVLRIDVPKGLPVIYVPAALGLDPWNEAEVLLPRGMSFEVISDTAKGVDIGGRKYRLIHVKALEPKPQTLSLSHVRAHTRRVHGKVVHVKAYDTKTVKAAKVVFKREDFPPASMKFDPIEQSVGPDDRDFLNDYVDEGDYFNRLLRTDFPQASYDEAKIAHFDEVLSKGTVTKDFVTYRSMVDADWLPSGKVSPGTILTDKGYSSTTPFGSTAANWVPNHGVTFAIHVPKGAKAIYVPDVMGEDRYSEAEVLLPRGTRFEVISDDADGLALEMYDYRLTARGTKTLSKPKRLITMRLLP